MLELETKLLEVRGIENKTSKKGNVYYNLYCENSTTGEPHQFYVNDATLFPDGLKKGSLVRLVLVYNNFKELRVVKILKGEK